MPTATTVPTDTPAPQPTTPGVYVVKPGDTLFGIAVSVGRSAEAIAAYNNIKDPTSLRPNQELRIPPADYTPVAHAYAQTASDVPPKRRPRPQPPRRLRPSP